MSRRRIRTRIERDNADFLGDDYRFTRDSELATQRAENRRQFFPEGVVLATVTITRYLTNDDIIDHVDAVTSDGYELGLAEALGMVELAKFTLVETYTSEMDDD